MFGYPVTFSMLHDVAKEFLELICLISFLNVPTWDTEANENLDLVEFFSGRARISKLASWVGYRVRCFDILYKPNMHPGDFKRGRLRRSAMDLNGQAGFVYLCLKRICNVFLLFFQGVIVIEVIFTHLWL